MPRAKIVPSGEKPSYNNDCNAPELKNDLPATEL